MKLISGIPFVCAALMCACASTPKESPKKPQSPAPVVDTVSESTQEIQNAVSDDELRRSQDQADLMIYESWPLETSLNNDHIADVIPVWVEAIDAAQSTLDFEQYYITHAPDTGLDQVVQAIRRAGERGVKIRFLIDSQMASGDNGYKPDAIESIPNLELRIVSFNALTGGIQHAKFFIVDGKTLYFGSQNFDWRSLEHISEIGARVQPESFVQSIKDIFELDWKLAENPQTEIASGQCPSPVSTQYHGESIQFEAVASPKNYLPCADMWDLPKLLDLIKGAQKSVSIQLLNYATKNYDKTEFKELDDALIEAADRGVKVRLLVSDWSTKPKNMSDLKRLAQIDNIETRMIEIPEHSMGFVPYSRTIHSKFMLVDDDRVWIGTSNWAGDYFYKSRNIGLIAVSKLLKDDLSASFEKYWNSEYAIPVDPSVQYPVKNQAKKE